MKKITNNNLYWFWSKYFGVESYKYSYYLKYFLYKILGIKLPKLRDQRNYWDKRGRAYMDEIMQSGYIQREVFFQDMLIEYLRKISFHSFFEAGCGFGWNIRRVKEEFPKNKVGGVDFSSSQLEKSKSYLKGFNLLIANSDICNMPFKDNSFDVGFSLGVFMNIHPEKVEKAVSEMIRVCKEYIIHVEYDENNTKPELKEKRVFKTNIISHDYKSMYTKLGLNVIDFKTYKEFGHAYNIYQKSVKTSLDRWEGFEGAEKYIWIVIKCNK